MKNINVFKSIALAMIAMIIAPSLALANHNNAPTISLLGVTDITQTHAIASVSFYSDVDMNDLSGNPQIYVEFTNQETNETNVTISKTQFQSSNVTNFWLEDLDPKTEYSYRAVLVYGQDNYRTPRKEFTTAGATRTYENTTTNDDTVAYTQPTIGSERDNTVVIPSIWSIFGTTTTNQTTTTAPKTTTTITDKIKTGGGVSKNGIGLAITNEQARVDYNDRITFTITYQNTTAASINNVEIAVELPEQYEFLKSADDVDYNERTNTVMLDAGRLAAKTKKTFTFTARAVGAGNDDVKTTVTMDYDNGSLSTSDRDAYHGRGTTGLLGASIFGAGFFPQTFLGWLAIVVLIALIIIVARRYTIVPATPEPEKTKTA